RPAAGPAGRTAIGDRRCGWSPILTSVSGVTSIDRLVQMLDSAGIALLVLTAEDERADGAVVARQNVVHEAGLFQGRLGFSRAIIMIEDGCEEFSNVTGLGQIRFPKGKISAVFEDVRLVLEREGFLS
ncbi:TIR domain-containing protein, partial [Frankia sp. AgB32]|uniref:TIR domain-containing protein n=1 Tax=Frankia sp. AgB32 TaxID=631119 RepID=UPI00200BB06D